VICLVFFSLFRVLNVAALVKPLRHTLKSISEEGTNARKKIRVSYNAL
jgi:hypothetical protein